MPMELADDGTLDTVIRCSDCHAEERYNYDASTQDENEYEHEILSAMLAGMISRGRAEMRVNRRQYEAFVLECCEEMASSHDCPAAFDADRFLPEEYR